MGKHRLSFTERRRASMAMKFNRLDQMEPRSLITDPISLAGLSMGLPLVWGILGLTRIGSTGWVAIPPRRACWRRRPAARRPHREAPWP